MPIKKIASAVLSVFLITVLFAIPATVYAADGEELPSEPTLETKDDSLLLYVGNTYILEYTATTADGEDDNVTFTSSDENIAEVTNSGFINAKEQGNAVISLVSDSGLSKDINITVKNVIEKSISVNKTYAKMGRGEKYTLKTTFSPSNTTDKDLVYSSSNKSVATVDSKGTITAKKNGKATITIKSKYNKTAKCEVVVSDPATSIKLNYTSATIGVGEKTLDLNSQCTGTSFVRYYSSYNSSVAAVTGSGVVIGKKTGTVTIVVSTYNGKKTYCKVTVKSAPKSITFTNKNFKVMKGTSQYKLQYKLSSGSASFKNSYSSSNNSIATVNSKGIVTGKKAGTVTITFKTFNGSKSQKIKIVSDNSLSLNLSSTQYALDYSNVKKVTYGTSYQGRKLEAFVITGNGKNNKTLVCDFAVHGFEDSYAKDGKVLVAEGNKLVEYYAKHPKELGNYRIVIVPCANPDGVIAGKNNKRSCSTAFGRCTANHIDMNRDFGPFKAKESRALRGLWSKYKPNVYINFHGWLNETMGNKSIGQAFCKRLKLPNNYSGQYGSSQHFAIAYVQKKYKAKSCLVEYKSPKSVSHTNTVKALNDIM